jgi:sensor histidine kinase regulating citrate/malate metabolism
MKSFEEIVPLAVAIIVAIVLFFGFISAVKKSLQSRDRNETIDSAMFLKEQKWQIEDVQKRQKELMQAQRQKIRDLKRR